MKRVAMLGLAVMIIAGTMVGCMCYPYAAALPEGAKVKVYIHDRTLYGELLSVTPELIVIKQKADSKDEKGEKREETIIGCPTPDTEVVKVQKGCGAVVNLFLSTKKYEFKDHDAEEVKANLVDLSHFGLYGAKIPDHVREQMKLFGQ